MISCICLGPKRSGKTHLLKALQDNDSIDENTYSSPTNGTSIYNIVFPNNINDDDAAKRNLSTKTAEDKSKDDSNVTKKKKKLPPLKSICILEIGGSMAPIWRQYFTDVKKLMYVVDTSNLCQISAAGVLFYSILSEPRTRKTRILLVLSKMDYAYRQMRNEALLMLQMSKLEKEIKQQKKTSTYYVAIEMPDDTETVFESPEAFNFLDKVISVESSNYYFCVDDYVDYDHYYTSKEQEEVGCLKCLVYTILTAILIYTIVFICEVCKNSK